MPLSFSPLFNDTVLAIIFSELAAVRAQVLVCEAATGDDITQGEPENVYDRIRAIRDYPLALYCFLPNTASGGYRHLGIVKLDNTKSFAEDEGLEIFSASTSPFNPLPDAQSIIYNLLAAAGDYELESLEAVAQGYIHSRQWFWNTDKVVLEWRA